jgi:ligand-binding SRPBCC domain-containing protein
MTGASTAQPLRLGVAHRQWMHEHTFEERGGGTLVRDRVAYAVPGGPLEPLLARLVVKPGVRRIFAYRQAKMREPLGGPSA